MNKKQDKISRMIMNYLWKNPEAGDTLEGITRWWLGLERIELSVDEVAKALKRLVEKGIIRAHTTRGSTIFYKINKEN